MDKKIVLSLGVALALLSGCGGSSGNDDNGLKNDDTGDRLTINGKAIDGYLRYATVCLDLNGDGYCQPSEPFTLTDKDGSFNLDVTKYKDNLSNKNIVAFGGQDSDSGTLFSGVVMNKYDKNLESINVTPITTIVTKLEESGKTKEEAKSKVAKLLGVDIDNLDKDPIKEAKNNPTLLKATLQLQKSVDILVEAKKEISAKDEAKIADDVLDEIAKSLKTTTLDANSDTATKLTKVIKDSKIGDINSSIVDKVEVVAKGIDEAINVDDFKKSNDISEQVKIATINIHKLKEDIKQKDKDSVEALKDAIDIFKEAGIQKVTKSSIEAEYLKNLTKSLEVDDIDFNALASTLKAKKVDITDLDYKELKEALEKYSLKDEYSSLYDAVLGEVAKQEQKQEEIKIISSDKFLTITLPLKYYNIDDVELRNNKLYIWSQNFSNGVYDEEDYEADLQTKEISINNHQDNEEEELDLILKDGIWQEEPDGYQLSSDNKVLSIDTYNADFVLKEKTDLNGKTKTLLLSGMDTPLSVKFSKGAIEYKAAYKFNKDFYELGHTKNYNSLEDFINEHTQKSRWFSERDGIGIIFEKEVSKLKLGDSGKLLKVTNLHSGYNNEKISGEAGEWKVEKLPNSNIVALMIYLNDDFGEDEERRFYSMYKGKVAKGYSFKTMSDYRLMNHFTGNEQAIKDIIEALSKYSSKGDEVSNDKDNSDKGDTKIAIDPTLQASVSLSGKTITVKFNKDMKTSYRTTGEYNPAKSYWVDNRTFKIDFNSYTPGGHITFSADGFITVDNKKMSNNITFTFPKSNTQTDVLKALLAGKTFWEVDRETELNEIDFNANFTSLTVKEIIGDDIGNKEIINITDLGNTIKFDNGGSTQFKAKTDTYIDLADSDGEITRLYFSLEEAKKHLKKDSDTITDANELKTLLAGKTFYSPGIDGDEKILIKLVFNSDVTNLSYDWIVGDPRSGSGKVSINNNLIELSGTNEPQEYLSKTADYLNIREHHSDGTTYDARWYFDKTKAEAYMNDGLKNGGSSDDNSTNEEPKNPETDPNTPENGGGDGMHNSEQEQIIQQFVAQFGDKIFYKPDVHDGKATITKYTFNMKNRDDIEMIASESGDNPVTIKIQPVLNGFFFQYGGKTHEYNINSISQSDYYLMNYSENGKQTDQFRFYFDGNKAEAYLNSLKNDGDDATANDLNFIKDMISGKTFYYVEYDDFGIDGALKWNMAKMQFTDSTMTWSEYDTDDSSPHTFNYTIENGVIVIDEEHLGPIKLLNNNNNDYMIVTDSDKEEQQISYNDYLFYDYQKAKSFRDKMNSSSSDGGSANDLGALLAGKTVYIAYKNENAEEIIEKLEFSQDMTSVKDTYITGPEAGKTETVVISYEDGKLYHDNQSKYDELISVTNEYILVKKSGTEDEETGKFFFTIEAAQAYLDSL